MTRRCGAGLACAYAQALLWAALALLPATFAHAQGDADWAKVEAAAKKEVLSAQPTGRFVTVEEIGALAAFLSSDAARSITGANYSIDGGWVAR